MRTVTLVFISGGTVVLTNPFIVGTGVAGTISNGETRWFNDNTIERVIEH